MKAYWAICSIAVLVLSIGAIAYGSLSLQKIQTTAAYTETMPPTTTATTDTSTNTNATTSSSASCTTNLVISRVNASSDDGNIPTNAIDNNLSTRWSGYGIGSWIRADLGTEQQKTVLCYVDIAWYKGNERSNNFQIAVSNDGNTYTNVYSGKSSGTTLSAERYNLAGNVPQPRYVKITVNGNTQNNWASITEVHIGGKNYTTSGGSGDSGNNSNSTTPTGVDKFGIRELYPTVSGGNEWFSDFAVGSKRTLTHGHDQYDSRFVVSSGTLTINGDGTAQLTGRIARLNLLMPHENVEVTMYGQLVTKLSSVQSYSGHDIQARTADGHHSGASSSVTCLGKDYTENLMYRQAIKFEKELNHPYYTRNNPEIKYSWDPSQWVGVKYLVRNTNDGVKLEVYIDKTNGLNGGTWVKTYEYTDRGGWKIDPSAAAQCGIPADYIIKGYKQPLVIFRDDGVTKNLKYLSIREIAPIS